MTEQTQPEYEPIFNRSAQEINECCRVVHAWAKKKGWWDKPEWRLRLERCSGYSDPSLTAAIEELKAQPVRNKGELLALIHSETSEALEYLRAKHQPAMDDKVPSLPGEHAELADTVIRIFDYCGAFGIDLGEAIRKKHEFNITRPPKHGKNF